MSITELHPTEPKPERRRFQYSLQAMFGLTTGTAAFFALARMLGYVDAVVALAAILVLVGIMEYPRRVHLLTGILLTLVAGMLLWANLRTERHWGSLTPDQLDPMAEAMFFRGWPLRPCMVCLISGMKFHPSEPGVYGILAFDGIVFVAALFVTRGVRGLCLRRRGRPIIKTPLDTTHPRNNPPPDDLTSGSLVE